MRRPILILLVTLCVLTTAEDFEIKFSRPLAVGEKFKVTTTCSKDETVSVSIDGKKLPDAKGVMAVDLSALVEVLKYDSETRNSQKKYIVESCTKSSGAEKSELLKKDQVVVATGAGRKSLFDVDNQTADDETARLLDMVIYTSPGALSEDEVFGSLERKQVGDIWPVRIDAMKRSLEKFGFLAEPREVSGTVKLAAVKEIDGVRCLSLQTQVQIGNIFPYKFTPNQTIEKMDISMEATIEIPVKRGSSTAHYVKKMTMAVTTVEDRNGKKVQSDLSVKQTEESHYRDVKK